MAGWYLSEQARQALRTARDLARGRRALGSADPLLVAILERWDDERFGGPALLRACGLTAEQAGQVAATLLPTEPPEAAAPDLEPRIIGTLRFVLDQAERIAAEARAPYVGTEHLVVAMLWQDTQASAHQLRRQGVSYAQAVEQLATLPHTEQAEQIDPLEEVQAPTPAVARLDELARQQAEQHPIQGDGRISTLHHLLALLVPPTATNRLLRELGVDYYAVVRHIEEEGTRRVAAEDWRPEELPFEGWEEFRVTDQQHQVIRGRFHAVNKELGGGGSGSCSARTWTTRNGRWCASIPVGRAWTRVRCWIASSARRRNGARSGDCRDSSVHGQQMRVGGAVARQASGRHEVALELPEHLARELEVLAKRWTLQLLFLLLQRPARFSELERAVPGLTNRVMADRLRELQDAGLVDRQVDPGPPISSNYALTADGEALRPILMALRSWAHRRARTRPG
jgi:DNA-binding HxlR family transcriptional regulator